MIPRSCWIERCGEFLDWFLADVPIQAIWLWPVRQRDQWTLYPMRADHTYVNLGFWSTVPGGSEQGETNRRIERKVRELDGLKSLYSDAYYTPDEFDRLYGAGDYRSVKQNYDPDARFLDLYAKAVQRR